MKETLYRLIKYVKKFVQAGDAVLVFYYHEMGIKNIEILRNENAPLDDKHFHGKRELTLWGVAVGFKKIPLLNYGSFSDSLQAVGFSEEEIKQYTHFIVNGVQVSDLFNQDEFVRIYRLSNLDHSEIANNGCF